MRAESILDELCSRYLDGDLPAGERRRFERLLAEDEALRRRLTDLEALVRDVVELPREASPVEIGAAVRRRVAAESASRRWLDRVQGGLQRLVLDSPLLASFAVVLALAVILYLLAHGAARWAERPTTLVVAPGTAAETRVAIGERRFARRDGIWWEEGVTDVPGAVLREEALEGWLRLRPSDRELSELGGTVVVAGREGAVALAFGVADGDP